MGLLIRIIVAAFLLLLSAGDPLALMGGAPEQGASESAAGELMQQSFEAERVLSRSPNPRKVPSRRALPYAFIMPKSRLERGSWQNAYAFISRYFSPTAPDLMRVLPLLC